MITCTRRLQFCSGHRVHGHEGKCRHLHGHNYVVMLTASADALDNLGRVIDFSVLKARLGGWIDQHWDHGCVIWDGDTEAQAAVLACQPAKLFLLPSNPTAENMADYLLRVVGPEVLADTGIGLTAVRLWKTENCYADATL